MKWTKASVWQDAKDRGLEPMLVDSIPEGFAWFKRGLTIGGVEHPNTYVAYIPLTEQVTQADSIEQLLSNYKEHGV